MSTQLIRIDKLKRLDTPNPNAMTQAKLASLQTLIKQQGFLQPILVQKKGTSLTLIDGEHRCLAMIELGESEIQAVVVECSDNEAKLLRIGLNKLRGELDYTAVTEEINKLLDDNVFTAEELLMTGLSAEELDAMQSLFSLDEDDILSGSSTHIGENEDVKSFNITLKFDSELERAQVKEYLLRGHESLEEGILEIARR